VADNYSVSQFVSNGHRQTEPGPFPVLPTPGVLPVPELTVVDDVSALLSTFGDPPRTDPAVPARVDTGSLVTDEDRNRFGALLDRAAERGLLTPQEYESRLGELAEAESVEAMRTIVTELPIMTAPASAFRPTRSRPLGSPSVPNAPSSGPPDGRNRSSRWFLLAVVVVVMVVAMLFFAIYATHMIHGHATGSGSVMGFPGSSTAFQRISALRS